MNRNVYTETQILACNCEKLFDVIADVASYPQYLHGWEQVRVTRMDDGATQVEQHVRLGPLDEQLTSIARFERPYRIMVEPLSDSTRFGVALEWQLSSNGSGHCQVRLQIESRAHNPILRQIINHYIQRTSKQMFSRFSQRVEKLYGESCKLL